MENSGRLSEEEREKFSTLKMVDAIRAAIYSKTNSASVRDNVIIREFNKKLFFCYFEKVSNHAYIIQIMIRADFPLLLCT